MEMEAVRTGALHEELRAPRTYSSPLRAYQAAATRLRILAAASGLFGEHGYAGTTLREIARAAGVSLDTVQSQGTKAELFLAAFDLARSGEEWAFPAAASLEGVMATGCAFVAEANRRSTTLWRAFVGAALSDPQLAKAYTVKMRTMRDETRAAVEVLIARGMVKQPEQIEELADELWANAHFAQYDLLVRQAGWSGERYLAWLTERMIATVRRHCG